MGFAAEKIRGVDDSVKRTRSDVLNESPSQKTGKLRSLTEPFASAVTNAAGTATDVGHVVAKIAGAFGATGIQKALEGSSKTKWRGTYGKNDSYVPGDPGWTRGQEKKLSKNDFGERSGRRLKDFQSQFSSVRNGARIDPLNTF